MRMKMGIHTSRRSAVWLCLLTGFAAALPGQEPPTVKIDPDHMARLGSVDPRYLSYNVEMVEVTGGRFWRPYASLARAADEGKPPVTVQAGDASALYEYRPPLDLNNPRVRRLAAALGPAYIRVSGTWANSTWFQNDDQPALTKPPEGFRSVLTRPEWKGVIDFAQAADARLVTSFAISPGTRNAEGVWQPEQAQAFLDYTRAAGGSIAAAEYMNEPNFPSAGGAPPGYDAAEYGRDAKIFGAFLHKQSPQTIFLGPGSVGEGVSLMPAGAHMPQIAFLHSEDLLQATGPVFDAFSYHFYGAVSHRCGKMEISQALSADWLDRTDTAEAFYAGLRDRYLPGKAMWLTETGEAACGGDPFAAQFADTFRFLNQLGTLAQKGVQVVMRNTLDASDYGLLAEGTFEPRPDYWAALLWKRLMGPVVLDPHPSAEDSALRIYAQCMNGRRGGITVLVMNTDTTKEHTLAIPAFASRYTLTADSLSSGTALLNGHALHAGADGSLPQIAGEPVQAGTFRLAPASITFLAFAADGNKSCQ
jgi:heparanase 1